jgi:hypothetical protein
MLSAAFLALRTILSSTDRVRFTSTEHVDTGYVSRNAFGLDPDMG